MKNKMYYTADIIIKSPVRMFHLVYKWGSGKAQFKPVLT